MDNRKSSLTIVEQIVIFKLFLTVSNSQNSLDTSNPTVAKLLEVDAELATTEAQLSAQLQSIQEKRHSLKTVIDLFAPTDTTTTTPIATPPETPVTVEQTEAAEEEVEPTTQDVVTKELDQPKTDTTVDADAPVVPDTQKRQAKKNSSPTSKKQSTKSLPQKKTSKEPETWHEYLKDEFTNGLCRKNDLRTGNPSDSRFLIVQFQKVETRILSVLVHRLCQQLSRSRVFDLGSAIFDRIG